MIKREGLRVKIRDSYRARLVVADDIEINDISITGICIKTSKYLMNRNNYRVHIISQDNEEIMPRGKVVRSCLNCSIKRNGDTMPVYEVALKFVQLSNRERYFVRDMLNSTMSSADSEQL
jgi:hypothetical protein